MEILERKNVVIDISLIDIQDHAGRTEACFDFISYLESYRYDKKTPLFDGGFLNPILDKHKLKEVYNQLLDNELEDEIRIELINIIKNSFNIETDINDFLLTPDKIIKNKSTPFTFEELFYLWQRKLIK